MRDKIYQEKLCLKTTDNIDDLLTNLFLINNFKDFNKYEHILTDLKIKIKEIYWEL